MTGRKINNHGKFSMNSQKRSDLRPFFEPGAIAIIGSFREPTGLGYGVIKNMLHFGFKGNIYPINPSFSEVRGLKAYSAVNQVAGPIDLAIVITPPPTVPAIIEQCAQKGVKAALVVSENFAEAGEGGARLQQQLKDIAHRTGIRIMGPNTIGLFNTANGLVTTPYLITHDRIRKGSIAYCSQSGFVSVHGQPLEDRAYPISKMCDIGNKCDIDEVDVLDYLADDSETKIVAMHLEDVKNGRRFMDAARKVVARKPLLILKSGRTEAGARASASHTGSLAGNEQVYDNAIKQVGAIRVNTWQEFWEVPKVFAYQPLPKGNRIAIITLTGGAGVVGVDAAIEAGLAITSFSDSTSDKLMKMSPRLASNPVDISPVASVADNPLTIMEETIAAALKDTNVDCATIVLAAGQEAFTPLIIQMLERLMQHFSKPVTIWIYGMKFSTMLDMSRQLEARGLPTYFELETAIKALAIAASYSKIKLDLAHDVS